MSSSNNCGPPEARGSDDNLRGLEILLVEDSQSVADALKQHLELLGAQVAGPAATTAEAMKLITKHLPGTRLQAQGCRLDRRATARKSIAVCTSRADHDPFGLQAQSRCGLSRNQRSPAARRRRLRAIMASRLASCSPGAVGCLWKRFRMAPHLTRLCQSRLRTSPRPRLCLDGSEQRPACDRDQASERYRDQGEQRRRGGAVAARSACAGGVHRTLPVSSLRTGSPQNR